MNSANHENLLPLKISQFTVCGAQVLECRLVSYFICNYTHTYICSYICTPELLFNDLSYMFTNVWKLLTGASITTTLSITKLIYTIPVWTGIDKCLQGHWPYSTVDSVIYRYVCMCVITYVLLHVCYYMCIITYVLLDVYYYMCIIPLCMSSKHIQCIMIMLILLTKNHYGFVLAFV